MEKYDTDTILYTAKLENHLREVHLIYFTLPYHYSLAYLERVHRDVH